MGNEKISSAEKETLGLTAEARRAQSKEFLIKNILISVNSASLR